jgi:hypothetical protein
LTPDAPLTGKFVDDGKKANVRDVLASIEGALEDEAEKRASRN